mmetsp:Transcript_24192/g.34061  ORF Transcript_24192/g.34061 Transcript_24192/m.34061 type:complete len:302 (+) Transcript_24192:102-1007(+)
MATTANHHCTLAFSGLSISHRSSSMSNRCWQTRRRSSGRTCLVDPTSTFSTRNEMCFKKYQKRGGRVDWNIVSRNSKNTQCFATSKDTNDNNVDPSSNMDENMNRNIKPNTNNDNNINAAITTTTTTTTDTNLGRTLRGLLDTGMNPIMEKGSIVIAKADIPNLGIWMDQSYELQSIYLQGVNSETQLVEQIQLDTLQVDSSSTATIPNGYTRYITLYSPLYHDQKNVNSSTSGNDVVLVTPCPVVVTPEEVGLVSLRDEVMDSIIFALPVLTFWLTTSFVFVKQYNERYGGTFVDALLGR